MIKFNSIYFQKGKNNKKTTINEYTDIQLKQIKKNTDYIINY